MSPHESPLGSAPILPTGPHLLDSLYRELDLEPPKTYFIGLRQMEADLDHMLYKIVKIYKMHVQNVQGRHSLKTKSPCGMLNNIAKYQGVGSTICRYLVLFAANHFAICRYLSLNVPLFGAIYCSDICRHLVLIVINWCYLPLTTCSP